MTVDDLSYCYISNAFNSVSKWNTQQILNLCNLLNSINNNENNTPEEYFEFFYSYYIIDNHCGTWKSYRKIAFDLMLIIYNNYPSIREKYVAQMDKHYYKDRFILRSYYVPRMEDGINYDAPQAPGLYMISQLSFSKENPNIKYYWIKIGISYNLARRMHEYNTHCPMLWRIDYKTDYKGILETNERYYHLKLRELAMAQAANAEEWFLVDEKTYNELCDKGFSYFD